jgi:hypothetical protein
MNAMRLNAGLVLFVAIAALPIAAQDKGDEPAVKLKTVKYDGLAETITQYRGKVVVVDLWGFF